jgi:hypothetical protein
MNWLMKDEQPIRKSPLQSDKNKSLEGHETIAAAKLSSDGKVDTSPAAEPAAPKKLTPEEQMALYEKELKEDDWGHQPC